jgi:serine/threonine protein kinase
VETPSISGTEQAPEVTAEEFLRAVLRSGLLQAEELKTALKGVPRELRRDAQVLANHLVRGGKLSRFQSSKLLRGLANGLVLGPFQLLAPLGKGGMGTVFLSRDARSQQLVALKILPPKRARNEERMLVRFRREMEMSRRLTHPHLAYTYDVGEQQGVHYIAMEYIPGKTLSRLVADEGPLHYRRAARLLAEVASGLAHAHAAGIIHRDLKPSNIQVTPRDHAKVLDMGLALYEGEKGDALVVGGQGYIVGSMDYIAPEQTTDAVGVDARADVYSLGCTLYFALTGQQPFPGGTSREKIQRHRNEEPAPLSALQPSLPPAFVLQVQRMMAKDPARRPTSAREVEEQLRAWAAGEPEQPPDPPPPGTFDEAALATQGSGEYSAFTLPPLQPLPEPAIVSVPADLLRDAPPGNRWVLVALTVALTVLLCAGFLGLLGLWLGRR